jgi:hypothetical protein
MKRISYIPGKPHGCRARGKCRPARRGLEYQRASLSRLPRNTRFTTSAVCSCGSKVGSERCKELTRIPKMGQIRDNEVFMFRHSRKSSPFAINSSRPSYWIRMFKGLVTNRGAEAALIEDARNAEGSAAGGGMSCTSVGTYPSS